jgi:altronate hydrolase
VTAHPEPARAIKLKPDDTVAVLIEGVRKGQAVTIIGADQTGAVIAAEGIPCYHKIALSDASAGQRPVRNGIPIGIARTAIRAGAWVHTHNLESAYARRAEGSDV